MTVQSRDSPDRRDRGAAVDAVLDSVLARRAIAMRYQPVVDLATGEVVGFEALARPEGRDARDAAVGIVELQDAAARRGLLGELDWICRASATADPAVARLPASLAWLVNAEPRAIAAPCPPDLAARLRAADRAGGTVVEITERAITDTPADLLRGVGVIRAQGSRIALDDVGVDPASLALLPILTPDVVKLDAVLLRYLTDPPVARVAGAVQAYAERSGAAVLAEGVETEAQLRIAQALGATHAQGHLFGTPSALPAALPEPRVPLPRLPSPPIDASSPFGLLSAARRPRRTVKQLLIPLRSYLEEQADDRREPLALFAHFQAGAFTPAVRARFEDLGRRFAFVAALGPRIGPLPEGVRGGDPVHAPMPDEWAVIVLGPHYCAALAACAVRAGGTTGEGADTEFDYVITYDRALVEQAARTMASRLVALPT